MIFNTFEFIFLFLPITFILYFIINKFNFTVAKLFLVLASLFFYAYWNPNYLYIILLSLVINFVLSRYIVNERNSFRKTVLTLGILFNVGLLGFYKYFDFVVTNINAVFSTNISLLHLLLPLAISFYTFQQIAYLVDSYRLETKNYTFFDYALFVTFFPQLIAGPIVHHDDVMDQFKNSVISKLNYKNIALGLFIFSIGMFKKVAIADYFAVFASSGYRVSESLTFIDAWITSLSYTIQLYFDFSGYSDMAIGLALLFNIKLPRNFNSPYKALSIQDFWRRWHITLSAFLTKYIYIPLGGNRKGAVRTYINILIIFFVSGFWHGAGWTFVLWGIAHGVASVINRFWSRAGFKLPKWLAWFITFQFVNAAWVLFRAPSLDVAVNVYKGMLGLNGFMIPQQVQDLFNTSFGLPVYAFSLADNFIYLVVLMIITFAIAFFAKNSLELGQRFKPNFVTAMFCCVLFIYTFFKFQHVTEFLYFNF
ncbi:MULTISPECIES: MBOAT family O-acyltransferase [Bacillus]|uniref:MBOAT family O-acyltransferase n=1 Tax=Bacillus TaxID=1386 RepID=UPI0002D478D6|nr:MULTISPECIES: MBOAT family O-acyltransferase [Bacillus]